MIHINERRPKRGNKEAFDLILTHPHEDIGKGIVGIPLMAPGIGGAACRGPAHLACWVLLLSVIRQCLIVVGNPEDDAFEAEVEANLQLGAFANTPAFCSPALSVCPAPHWAILNFRVTMAREMSQPQQCAAWRDSE